MKKETIIGVISDTHGKLDNKVDDIFSNVDYILHAGDIGDKGDVIIQLQTLAPLYAVRGNCDIGHSTSGLTYELELSIANIAIYMTHAYQCIDPVKEEKAQLVIYGHSHMPEIDKKGKTHYLNPGSASQRRRSKACSVALVKISEGVIDIDIVYL